MSTDLPVNCTGDRLLILLSCRLIFFFVTIPSPFALKFIVTRISLKNVILSLPVRPVREDSFGGGGSKDDQCYSISLRQAQTDRIFISKIASTYYKWNTYSYREMERSTNHLPLIHRFIQYFNRVFHISNLMAEDCCFIELFYCNCTIVCNRSGVFKIATGNC